MPRTEGWFCKARGCGLHERCHDISHSLSMGAHTHNAATTGVYIDNSGGPAAPTVSMLPMATEFLGRPLPAQGDPRFMAILEEMKAIHIKKAADYGSDEDPLANLRASVNWGSPAWVGALMRLNDKVIRLQAFAKKGVLANESARDSMVDIAAYAILATILYDEESGDSHG